MATVRDFTVLGAGLVGLCVARRLRGLGRGVRVVDPRPPGGGASGQAAGLLEPPVNPRSEFQLARQAAWLGYEAFIEELESDSGVGIEFGSRPHVQVASDEAGARRLRRALERSGADRAHLEFLEGKALLDSEAPGDWESLRDDLAAALVHRRGHRVHPPDLIRALVESLRRGGARLDAGVSDLEVQVVDRELWKVSFRREGGEAVEFETRGLIIGAGAWTPAILESLGSPTEVAIEPVRGQMVALGGVVPGRSVLHVSGHYLYGDAQGRLVVGATTEDVGFDERVTEEGIAQLVGVAGEVLRWSAEPAILRTWCGLRPRAGRRGGAWLRAEPPAVLAGHHKNGILCGPRDADLLVARLTAVPLGEFSEFSRPGPAAGDRPRPPRRSSR